MKSLPLWENKTQKTRPDKLLALFSQEPTSSPVSDVCSSLRILSSSCHPCHPPRHLTAAQLPTYPGGRMARWQPPMEQTHWWSPLPALLDLSAAADTLIYSFPPETLPPLGFCEDTTFWFPPSVILDHLSASRTPVLTHVLSPASSNSPRASSSRAVTSTKGGHVSTARWQFQPGFLSAHQSLLIQSCIYPSFPEMCCFFPQNSPSGWHHHSPNGQAKIQTSLFSTTPLRSWTS